MPIGEEESIPLLWREVIVLNEQKSCFFIGVGRVMTKGMVKYASEELSRQYPL
jgi:hypothetical protein